MDMRHLRISVYKYTHQGKLLGLHGFLLRDEDFLAVSRPSYSVAGPGQDDPGPNLGVNSVTLLLLR
jgi:hypothetical protein